MIGDRFDQAFWESAVPMREEFRVITGCQDGSRIYDRLGVTPVINGIGTVTKLGGSLMPQPVVDAMREGAGAYVPLDEVQRAVGSRLAQLTRNDAAYVCSGAAAGLVLATAACVSGDDPAIMQAFPRPHKVAGAPTRVVMHACQRIGYDFAVRSTGVDIVEIGPTREAAARGAMTKVDDLEFVLNDACAAVLYIAGSPHAPGALPLEVVVQRAHAHGIPVIVDAAAQIPAVENLWHFSGRGGPATWAQALHAAGVAPKPAPTVPGMGADLAIFSGGKGLCGPQSAGLVLGRPDLIDSIRRQGPPNALIGRPMKVGKEELCGMLAAVEWYLGLDLTALAKRYEAQVKTVIESVAGLPGVTASRAWPNEAGQPFPRAEVTLSDESRLSRDTLQDRLRTGRPRIELSDAGASGVYVNPQNLLDGDAERIGDALRRLLA
jgi:L-seryl-tRNA(Ser) seleniumtransferase